MWYHAPWYSGFMLDIKILIFGLDIKFKFGLGYQVSK